MTITTPEQPLPATVPPAPAVEPLHSLWSEPVYKLYDVTQEDQLTDGEKERHRIYAHLLMQLVFWYWNGYKHGHAGNYPLNYDPTNGGPPSLSGDYYGHNIAALAVDKKGYILDFDFNHNELFVSSAEHAEARLVRRLYSLAQISEAWGALSARNDFMEGSKPSDLLGNRPDPAEPTKKRTTLADVTIYTSLEPCAQCSGVMALAAMPQVVYIQADPYANGIGRVLRNLTKGVHRAPRPISGRDIGLKEAAELDEKYAKFQEAQPIIWEPPSGEGRKTNSVTSFLVTEEAREIFRQGAEFEPLERGPFSVFHEHDPARKDDCTAACALSNDRLLAEAVRFLRYAKDQGSRGTPHNL